MPLSKGAGGSGGGAPTGAAGGSLGGTYPNPTLAATVTPGLTQLVYRYTVAGVDKASIDTGVDTPDAGSNVWTGGDLLEVYLYLRTDEAGLNRSTVDITLNNDGTSIYDRSYIDVSNTTVSGGGAHATAFWQVIGTGNAATSGNFGVGVLSLPNFAGTTGWKIGMYAGGVTEASQANAQFDTQMLGYRSASAVTRLKIIPDTAAVKLKVGSQLLIYKRLSA